MPKEFNNNEITILNEEVREVLGTPPNWIFRWGSMIILLLVIVLIFLSVFIKYPEVLFGKAIIKPNFEISNIIAKTGTIITAINIKDGDSVKKGSLLILKKENLATVTFPFEKIKLDSIYSPIDGRVVFQRLLTKNIPFSHDTKLLSIIPFVRKYDAIINMSAVGSGSIKIGQTVNIGLINYPASEFGQLTGTIITKPQYNGNIATVEVNLDNGTTTTYKKNLFLYLTVEGVADITISENSLYKKIFNFLK